MHDSRMLIGQCHANRRDTSLSFLVEQCQLKASQRSGSGQIVFHVAHQNDRRRSRGQERLEFRLQQL
jgi:hypothetical protein